MSSDPEPDPVRKPSLNSTFTYWCVMPLSAPLLLIGTYRYCNGTVIRHVRDIQDVRELRHVRLRVPIQAWMNCEMRKCNEWHFRDVTSRGRVWLGMRKNSDNLTGLWDRQHEACIVNSYKRNDRSLLWMTEFRHVPSHWGAGASQWHHSIPTCDKKDSGTVYPFRYDF